MTRQYVVEQYSKLLELPEEHTLCINLEKCTHNWSVKRSVGLGDTAASDNHRHMNRYKHKFLEIQRSLIHSPTLKKKILSGQFKTSTVVELSPQALWPGGPRDKDIEAHILKNSKKDYTQQLLLDPNYKGIFKCARCKGYKTTYYEMQTRSADEPMTVFITCHQCHNRWKS